MARQRSKPRRDTVTELGYAIACAAFVVFVAIIVIVYIFNT
jgi:hypothetical protein